MSINVSSSNSLSSYSNQNQQNVNITEIQINEIYLQCYNLYKKEYNDNRDFSIKSDDINEELDEILNEYNVLLKKRNDVLSTSIYSELLDDLEIDMTMTMNMYMNLPESNYNSSPTNVKKNPIKNKNKSSRRSFGEVLKNPKQLEINTDDEVSGIEGEGEEDLDDHAFIDDDEEMNKKIADGNVLLTEIKYKDSSNILDSSLYDISKSEINIKTDNSGGNRTHTHNEVNEHDRSNSEILISQTDLFRLSMISQNVPGTSLIMSNTVNHYFSGEDANNNHLSKFKIFDNMALDKSLDEDNTRRKSANESLEMSKFRKNKAFETKEFPKLDLPPIEDIKIISNADNINIDGEIRMGMMSFNDQFVSKKVHDSGSVVSTQQNLPSDISHYSQKFLSDSKNMSKYFNI
jgi:hypothetical protein